MVPGGEARRVCIIGISQRVREMAADLLPGLGPRGRW